MTCSEKHIICLDFVIVVIKIDFTIILKFVIQTRYPMVRNGFSKGVIQIQKTDNRYTKLKESERR